MAETRTEKDLKDILASYRDALRQWQQQLTAEGLQSQIKASKVDHPIQELVKVSQLIHANTTKMGIIFNKPLQDVNAAYKQTHELSTSSILLISLCSQMESSTEHSRLLTSELFRTIRNLLSALEAFVSELFNDEDDRRLVSVGKIWDVVAQLIGVAQMGKIGVLKLKLKEITSTIGDGIEELDAWIKDPESVDDDPFAFSDDEDSVDDTPPATEAPEEPDFSDIMPDAERYLNKIKLVKLLLNSLVKSIPTSIRDADLDHIYDVVRQYNEVVDEMIYKVIFEHNVTEAKFWYSKSVKISDDLIATMHKINKNDDKKLKWLTAWDSKYKE